MTSVYVRDKMRPHGPVSDTQKLAREGKFAARAAACGSEAPRFGAWGSTVIGERFNEKRQAVLDACERYLDARGDTHDGVDLDWLKARMKRAREGRYLLAVVGEAKAGKSTLINALLREPVLPTGVLQSSNAVVKILKADDKYVKVEYADGHSSTVKDDPSTHPRREDVLFCEPLPPFRRLTVSSRPR